jgi:hypothetical protein
MTTLEQAIETIKALPPAARRQLRQWLQEQEQQDAALPAEAVPPRQAETVAEQIARFRKAMKWIDEHRAEYLGQWVALEGDQLISHGPDVLQVDAAARAAGIVSPFLEQVREAEKPFCGGWS